MADYILASYECDSWFEEDGSPSNYWHFRKPREIIKFCGKPPAEDCKMPFGKYKGQRISSIAQKDFNYILWLNRIDCFGALRIVVNAWIDAHREGKHQQRKEHYERVYG